MPHFPSYDRTLLWYDEQGTGKPLVCLPGGPGADVRTLGDLGGLAEHRRLIRLDSRAGGRSAIPADQVTCAFAEQARDVEELRKHLGLADIDLLAHSAGTLTAQEYAARYGVHRLVLVTPAGRAAREPDEAEAAAIRAAGVATAEPVNPTFPPEWLRAAFYAGGSTDASRLARLAAVTSPVLAIAGAADPLAGTSTARLVGSLYPDVTVEVLPGCGHHPWLDDPDLFRGRLLAFLA